ncbi:putative 36.4 kDa proline-rich protein [Iris pallida]|uniref:36.4 kDa proline-rich protein n=1 Tax=Iris pallida TaxID=29817 RepID=A0AAX6DTB2_IRIPA|nr:putative 36.4 kDa proline-rich protein [Iris pallida]
MAIAMDISFLLILCIASVVPQAFANCGLPCTPPPPKTGPITVPPAIGKPPITIPPVIGKPPVTIPPLPPLVKPILPPVTVTPAPSTKPGCPPPPGRAKACPTDTVKLGACLDVLRGVGAARVGDAAAKCCPLIRGLASVDAALCLCTTIKLKLLSVKVFQPISAQLFMTCGKALPPGYTCA